MARVRDLPRGVHCKRGTYYLVTRIDGRPRWIKLGRDREQALAQVPARRDYYAPLEMGIRKHALINMLRRCRWRAKRYGLPFDLTLEGLHALCDEQQWRCALTGLPFSMSKNPPHRLAPFAPSLDRIDPAAGYLVSNSRIVVLAMNVALNEWGDKVFRTIAERFLDPTARPRRTKSLAPNFSESTLNVST